MPAAALDFRDFVGTIDSARLAAENTAAVRHKNPGIPRCGSATQGTRAAGRAN